VLLAVVMLIGVLPATSAFAAGTFIDDDGNVHEANIEFIAAAGITRGCNEANDRYCPSDIVTRGQMAAFINRALGLNATSTDFFTDDTGSIFEDDINRLAAAGITRGCDVTGTKYCVDDGVTRGQIAAFLNRALDLDPTDQDFFVDDNGSIFEDDINALAATGVTVGCGGGLYCINEVLKRDQMASLLARALQLSPTPPPPPPPPPPGGSPLIATSAYGIYADGAPASAPLVEGAGTENEPAVIQSNTPFQVRIEVSNIGSGPGSIQPKLQYRFIGSSTVFSPWTDVTGASERVRAADGAGTDGEATTERLSGVRAFVAGSVDEVDGAIGTPIALASDTDTEVVFSVLVDGTQSAANDQYEFRVVDVATGLYDDYGLTPSVNTPWSFANGFDSGADGVQIAPGASSADPDAWSEVAGGVAEYDDTNVVQGPLSALFMRTFDGPPDTYLRLNDFNQAREIFGRLYFRYTGFPTPGSSRIVDVVGGYEAGDINSHSLTIQNNGRINMRAGGTVGAGDMEYIMTTVLNPNEWYRIEWHATVETDGGLMEVRLYDSAGALVEEHSESGWPTANEFEDIDFGPRRQVITAWIDEVAISNQGWIGPVAP
jgi:hypothetical protein